MSIATAEDFITKFHNLDGDLYGERKKSLFILFKTASQNLTPEEIDNAVKNLNPTSYQERLFWVYTSVHFKQVSPLLEILKNCNRDHIKIVLKQKWFIKQGFKDITPVDLVNDFFPCVSYSTRLKLLWRIPLYWSEEKNDELFDCLQKRYGLFIALKVLHTCSAGKIRKILNELEPTLSTSQMIYVLNKNEDLLTTYLELYNKLVKKPYADKSFINILANKHAPLFLKLSKSNLINTQKLSRSSSIAVITVTRTELCTDSLYFFKMLNNRAIVKYLGSEFEKFFKNLFPKKIDDLNSDCECFQLLKHFPKSIRWEMVTKVFQTTFPNENLDEFLKRIDLSVVKGNPTRATIFRWAELKYTATVDDKYLMYYPPSNSITILRQKINVTSDMLRRQELLKLLISTCAENKDLIALDNVLEYIGSRHKNEDPYVIKRLLEFIIKSFEETKLTRRHWDFVYQQIMLLKAGGKLSLYDYQDITINLSKYLFENDKDSFRRVMSGFIKDCYSSCGWYVADNFENYKFQREILNEIWNLFPTLISAPNESQYTRTVRYIIEDIVKMNEKDSSRLINILEYPYLVSTIETTCNQIKENTDTDLIYSAIFYSASYPQYSLPFLTYSKITEILAQLNDSSYSIHRSLLLLIRKETLYDLQQKIIMLYLEKLKFDKWYLSQVVHALLKYQPKLFLLGMQNTLSDINWSSFGTFPNFYKHSGVSKLICDHIINNWSKADITQQENAIPLLMRSLPYDEFAIFFIKHLCPLKSVNELNTEDEIKLYKVQSRLAECLKKVNAPEKYLSILFKFCSEDFRYPIIPSLHSLLSRYNENLVYTLIKNFSTQNLTIQKHLLSSGCEYLDYNCVVNIIKSGNVSTHFYLKTICLTALKYSLKSGFINMLEFGVNCISRMDSFDESLFSSLCKINVAKNMRARFIEICWNIFEKLGNKSNSKVHKYLDKLLEQTFNEYVMKSMNSSFINKIISNYFLVEKDRLTNIDCFALLCLAYREADRQANYKLVFQLLPKHDQKNIHLFCSKINDLYRSDQVNVEFIKDFEQHWRQTFSFTDTLKEHIVLNLLLKSITNNLDSYAESIIEYSEQLQSGFGSRIFEMFGIIFREQIDKMDLTNKYELLRLMLVYKPSPSVCVLILQLLLAVDSKERNEIESTLKSIIEIIKDIQEPIVKCYFEMYLDIYEIY